MYNKISRWLICNRKSTILIDSPGIEQLHLRSRLRIGPSIVCGAAVVACNGCIRLHSETERSLCAGERQIAFNEDYIDDCTIRSPHFTNNDEGEVKQPIFSSPSSVLKYVLSCARTQSRVFPTERYYYYNFPLGPRHVSGNIRFADVENGTISVGYFDSYYPRDIEVAEYKDGDSGIRIKYNSELNSVDVAVDEIQRTFILDQSAFSKPPFQLLDGEEFISGVRDESGYFLYLIFWRPGRAFYYVLNTRESVPETWSRGDGAKIETWWGSRSRFCFLHNLQLDRYILVGVHEREVRENTWYDGPFDQVPPNLMIQHTLEVAYPYVIDAGGIDDHGNFLEMEGQRVAISPYQEYSSGPSLEAYLESVVEDRDTPDAWTKATYESKRDWRASRNALGVSAHASELSASWPANHWGISSTRWGAQHDAAVSVSWPPNHSVDTSKDSK